MVELNDLQTGIYKNIIDLSQFSFLGLKLRVKPEVLYCPATRRRVACHQRIKLWAPALLLGALDLALILQQTDGRD